MKIINTMVAASFALAISGSVYAHEDHYALSCSIGEDSVETTWTDTAEGDHYGGDLEATLDYTVTCNVDGEDPAAETEGSLEVEVSLDQDEDEAYWYTCKEDTCTGVASSEGIDSAIDSAVEDVAEEFCGDIGFTSTSWVGNKLTASVKHLNKGRGFGGGKGNNRTKDFATCEEEDDSEI